MSLIPAFEIGVWNVWIFMLYHFLPMPILMLIHRGTTEKLQPVPHSETEKKVYPLIWITWLPVFIYSIFLPLKLGTIWFYVGLPIALLGVITYTLSMVPWATTRIDNEPLAKGLYRYSRHPMYITQFVMFMGVGIASASWIFLLFSIVYTVLSLIIALPEERYCLEKYGDAYRKYMNRTPRWVGIPKD